MTHYRALILSVAVIGYLPGLFLMEASLGPTQGGFIEYAMSSIHFLANAPTLIAEESIAFWHGLLPYVLPGVLAIATIGSLLIMLETLRADFAAL